MEVLQRFEALTGHAPKEGYGLTEIAPLGTLQVLDKPARQGSVGLPAPHTTLEVGKAAAKRARGGGMSAGRAIGSIVFEGAGGRYEVPPEQWAQIFCSKIVDGDLSSFGHRT